MSENQIPDRRKTPRTGVNIPVKIQCPGDLIYLAEITSINENGFICIMKKSLPLSMNLKIIMLIPPMNLTESRQSQVLVSEGIVIREVTENNHDRVLFLIAVQFINMQEDKIALLKKVVNYYKLSIDEPV